MTNDNYGRFRIDGFARDYDSIGITREDHWVAWIPREDSGVPGIAKDYGRFWITGFARD